MRMTATVIMEMDMGTAEHRGYRKWSILHVGGGAQVVAMMMQMTTCLPPLITLMECTHAYVHSVSCIRHGKGAPTLMSTTSVCGYVRFSMNS